MPKANEAEHATRAKNLLKAELKRKGIGYRELAERLTAAGSPITEQGLNNKISRGGFSAAFMLMVLDAIEVETVRVA